MYIVHNSLSVLQLNEIKDRMTSILIFVDCAWVSLSLKLIRGTYDDEELTTALIAFIRKIEV